ncbi:MAG: nitroreductase family protein [Candidatus Helarchaeota archaeon]
MKVSDAILRRRSIRHFTDEPIPMADLIKILEAARWAPTAVNRQKTRFVLVTDIELLQKIAKTAKIVFYQQKHAVQAKAMVLVCLDSTNWIEEVGAAIQNMLLMAYALGIGSCWIGAFNRESVRALLKIPRHYKIFFLILFGHYTHEPKPPPRLELGKIAFLNQWRKPLVKPKASLLPKSGALSIAITKTFSDTTSELDKSPLADSNKSYASDE